MARDSSPVVRLSSPSALFLDEPSGTMVQYPATEAITNREFCLQSRPARQADGFPRGIQSARPPLQVDASIGGKNPRQERTGCICSSRIINPLFCGTVLRIMPVDFRAGGFPVPLQGATQAVEA